MNNGNAKKKPVNPFTQNILESLREIGNDTIAPLPGEFKSQILGTERKIFSGEIMPGENLEMRDVVSGKRQVTEREQKQTIQINSLEKEEKFLVEKRIGELKLQLKSIHEEILKAVKVTNDLEREVQIAAIQGPGDPSTYELYFLEHILSFIRSFREKAENAQTWLAQQNRRASKKNVWGQNYQKMKGKYLLSKEHYVSRSSA